MGVPAIDIARRANLIEDLLRRGVVNLVGFKRGKARILPQGGAFRLCVWVMATIFCEKATSWKSITTGFPWEMSNRDAGSGCENYVLKCKFVRDSINGSTRVTSAATSRPN